MTIKDPCKICQECKNDFDCLNLDLYRAERELRMYHIKHGVYPAEKCPLRSDV